MALPNWQRTITTEQGAVVPNAEITVVVEATGLAADIFSNREGTTPLGNDGIFFTGSDGFAEFYAAPGEYRIAAEGPSGSRTWRYEVLLGTATDNSWTGDNDFTGELDATGTLGSGMQSLIAAAVIDTVYPVGSYYTQYPDAASNTDATEFPTAQEPASLFGGTWAEQWATESIYFRTRGTDSDDGRTDGKQLDQMQRITGAVFSGGSGLSVGDPIDSEGALTHSGSVPGASGAGSGRPNRYDFDSADSPDARASTDTDGETRVTNRRIKVWKRTA